MFFHGMNTNQISFQNLNISYIFKNEKENFVFNLVWRKKQLNIKMSLWSFAVFIVVVVVLLLSHLKLTSWGGSPRTVVLTCWTGDIIVSKFDLVGRGNKIGINFKNAKNPRSPWQKVERRMREKKKKKKKRKEEKKKEQFL